MGSILGQQKGETVKKTALQWACCSQCLMPLMLEHSVLKHAGGGIICAAEKQAEHQISYFKRINF